MEVAPDDRNKAKLPLVVPNGAILELHHYLTFINYYISTITCAMFEYDSKASDRMIITNIAPPTRMSQLVMPVAQHDGSSSGFGTFEPDSGV